MQLHRLFLLLAVLTAAAPARATNHDTPGGNGTGDGTGTGTQAFGAGDFVFRLQRRVGKEWKDVTETDRQRVFNRVRCECKEPIRVTVELSTQGRMKRIERQQVRMAIGEANCAAADPNTRAAARCDETTFGPRRNLSEVAVNGLAGETTLDKLFTAGRREGGCSSEGQQLIWLQIFEAQGPDPTGSSPKIELELDGQAPKPPADVRVTSGDGALSVRWEQDRTRASDFQGYVVFCARGQTATAVYEKSYYDDDKYQLAAGCGASGTPAAPVLTFATSGVRGPNDGQIIGVPPPLGELNPAFVCSRLLTGQTSARLSGLQNGIGYTVGVATVDRRGNVSQLATAVWQTPIPTRDFYEHYREAGGDAEGGFCAYGGGSRRAASGVLGIAGIALLALFFRRGKAR